MKLIVGLGNPGIEYQFTPHNLGFLVVDRLAEQEKTAVTNRRCKALTGRATVAGEDVVLAKPETYMNLSGLSVRELLREYELDPAQDLVVLHDELDLPFGSVRLKQRGGSAGHNGVESVTGALGSDEYLRVRLGIAPDHPVEDGARFVLAQFKKSQLAAVDELVDRGAEAVRAILTEGVAAAMNRLHRKDQGKAAE